jgi:hypothetical protein
VDVKTEIASLLLAFGAGTAGERRGARMTVEFCTRVKLWIGLPGLFMIGGEPFVPFSITVSLFSLGNGYATLV